MSPALPPWELASFTVLISPFYTAILQPPSYLLSLHPFSQGSSKEKFTVYRYVHSCSCCCFHLVILPTPHLNRSTSCRHYRHHQRGENGSSIHLASRPTQGSKICSVHHLFQYPAIAWSHRGGEINECKEGISIQQRSPALSDTPRASVEEVRDLSACREGEVSQSSA